MGVLEMEWNFTDVMLTLCILGVLIIAYLTLSPILYWRLRSVPSVFAVPLLGSMTSAAFLRKSLSEAYSDMYNEGKGKRYLGFVKFTKPALLFLDPELIKNALNRDFNYFYSNDVFIDEKVDPMFGKNIFSLTGERWKKMRSALSPGFTSGKMKTIYPLVCEVSDNLKSYVTECVDASGDSGCLLEMKDLCARFTTEVIASIAFGLQCDAIRNPNTEFRRMGRQILEPSTSNGFMVLVLLQIPWLNKILRIPLIPDEVSNFFRSLVLSMVTKREVEGTNRNDYIQFYTELWKEGKLRPDYYLRDKDTDSDGKHSKASVNGDVSVSTLKTYRDELDDITAQAVGIFADGFETSSTLIGFTLFELAHCQEAQQKLRQEIEDTITRHGSLTYEALQDISYLDMVVQETLRLYPPAGFLSRNCTKRYLLPNPEEHVSGGGVWLEEGTPIIFPVYALQRDPRYFPNPENFDPERFSPQAKKSRPASTYAPFGDGPRVCIGQRLGLLQTKVAVTSVISRFQLSPNEKTRRPIVLDPKSFLTSSKHGLWVTLKHLKAKTS